MWTVCDLTLHILLSKLKNIDMREYELDQIQIPAMYFIPQTEEFSNNRDYLSQEFRSSQVGAQGTSGVKIAAVSSGVSTVKRELEAPKSTIIIKKARVV
jgi:hypothetical protein